MTVDLFDSRWWEYLISMLLWGISSAYILWGAVAGDRGHSQPRYLLGCFTGLASGWYFLGVIRVIPTSAVDTLSDVTSWAVAAALTATAMTGVRYRRKVEMAAGALEQAVGEVQQQRGEDE